MAVLDLHSVGESANIASLKCDICVVGSGPAGCTIARELSGTGLTVLLLESGGFNRLDRSDALDIIESTGHPRAEPWTVRNRIVGGSSHTWGGRCAPLDAIDFEERPWVSASGWPFQLDSLAPYFERTAPYLGLAYGNNFHDERFWQLFGRTPSGPEPDRSKLLPFFWQFSRDKKENYPFEYMRFGRHIVEQIGANVTLVTGATVLKIHTTPSGNAVHGVEWASPDGRRFILVTPLVALCAGGIGNARILLSSDQHAPTGLGNQHDLVGRYLMDHVRGPIGYFDPERTQSLQRRFGRYTVNGRLFRGGLRVNPDVQRDQHLLNSAVWLGETLAADDPWVLLRRIASGEGRAREILTLATQAGLLLRGCRDYFVYRNGFPRLLAELSLECMVEQLPDPDSRITLSEQRDWLGMRLPRVDWRVHADEARTMHITAELVRSEFERIGLPVLTVAERVRDKAAVPLSFVDVAHPTGTTRMADDPRKGVVDASGQVHGVNGLYVTGSSVFPTGGHCNPTQTIVALALRLADTLKLRASRGAPNVAGSAVALTPATPKVPVTEATGRIDSSMTAG
jgi:choline dehydrogenase-like flavoprotein